MFWKQLWLVIRHTFSQRLKSVGYWSLVLMPALSVLAVAAVFFILNMGNQQKTPTLAVINQPTLSRYLKEQKQLDLHITERSDLQAVQKDLRQEKITAYLSIQDDHYQLVKSAKAEDLDQQPLKVALQNYSFLQRAATLHLSPQAVRELSQPAIIKTQVLNNQGQAKKDNQSANYALTSVLAVVIFFFLTYYVGLIANEIANEKSSRIMEILLAASSPAVQFFGKLGGIGLLALLHAAIYLILGAIALICFPKNEFLMTAKNQFSNLNTTFLLFTLLMVLVTILLYMVLTAIVAAMVNDLSQVQQAVTPVTTLALVSYALTFMVNGQAHNGLITVLSFLPFESQSLMPARLALNYASPLQAWISLAIAIVTLVLLAYYGLRLYTRNVLTYQEGNLSKAAFATLWKLFKRP